MQLFWIIWMFILPILGITFTVLTPIFWWIIVPQVARMLTWTRFRNVNIHAIADDSGYVELVTTKEKLAEGVVRTKRGWRFLPRPRWKAPTQKRSQKEEDAEKMALQKYILRGLGKPFWFDYAGKVASVNPATLASLQQTTSQHGNPTFDFDKIDKYVGDLPKHFSKDLKKMLKELREHIQAVPVTPIDPRIIKQVLPQMYTPSQLDAVATNRELRGMARRGKEYGKLIFGGMMVMALLIFAVVALTVLSK